MWQLDRPRSNIAFDLENMAKNSWKKLNDFLSAVMNSFKMAEVDRIKLTADGKTHNLAVRKDQITEDNGTSKLTRIRRLSFVYIDTGDNEITVLYKVCSVHRRDTMSTSWDILSTSRDVQYARGIRD